MPFTMTHLIIADKISNIFSENIKDLPQFYLGNIAPDAIHQRADYISDFKKDSHLCAGSERWGMVTNNDEWKENAVNFLNRQKGRENQDFILGYCCHILADIYSNIALWIPFKKKYFVDIDKGYENLYHQESNKVDIQLQLTHERKAFYWLNLQQSIGVDLGNIIFTIEIERQKDLILNVWYKDNERQDISSNKIVTYESTMDFIKNATDFIVPVFQKYIYE